MMKKTWKAAAIGIGVLLMLAAINVVPALWRKTPGMNMLEGDWINVYYETEEAAAADTFELADRRAAELAALLGVESKPDVNIYIYDRQIKMQTKKYGLIAPLLGLDWYIGDNIGTDVILTSPANPGRVHNYENIKNAVLHEIVHAYNSTINPRMSYWVDNGLAGYLSGQIPDAGFLRQHTVPTLRQTRVGGLLAPVIFSNFGGYPFSYTYIEYLAGEYSWDAVSRFAGSGDYTACFGADEQEVYQNWTGYLESAYGIDAN